MRSQFQIFMHINFTEQGTPLDAALALAKSWGFDGVEVRRADLFGSMSDAAYFDGLCRAFDRSGLNALVLGAPAINLMQSDPAGRVAALADAMAFYEKARARLPVAAVNCLLGELRNPDPSVFIHDWHLHGSAIALEEHWEWAVSGGKILAAFLESVGWEAGLESHMRYLHDEIAPTLRLVEAIGSSNLGVTLDVGNLLMMKDPPTLETCVSRLAPRTKMTHLKNIVRTFHGEVAGARLKDGDINNRQFLRLLRDAGVGGILTIEAPSPGDRLAWAPEDLDYVRSLLEP